MDKLIRHLQRQTHLHPQDVEALQQYIHALERMSGVAGGGGEDNPEPFRLYLVSQEGARHEDRLPCSIFTSQGAALRALQASVALAETNDYKIGVGMQTSIGDYGQLTQFWGPTGEENPDWGFDYLVEGFEVDPVDLGPIY